MTIMMMHIFGFVKFYLEIIRQKKPLSFNYYFRYVENFSINLEAPNLHFALQIELARTLIFIHVSARLCQIFFH